MVMKEITNWRVVRDQIRVISLHETADSLFFSVNLRSSLGICRI